VLDNAEKNFEPVFSPMDPVVIKENEKIDLALEVVDVDGDNLVFTATNLPEGAELDVYEGVIRWKPGAHSSGRYPNIQIDVFDGRRHVKGTVEIQVEDAVRFEGAEKDPMHGLRHAASQIRGRSLEKLDGFAKTYQFLEAARLLRDRAATVRGAALEIAHGLGSTGDDAFLAMMVKDLAPHAWAFTDDPATLKWLAALAAKDKGEKADLDLLRASLKGIEKYNRERGVALR